MTPRHTDWLTKSPINPIINPNPVRSHPITWQNIASPGLWHSFAVWYIEWSRETHCLRVQTPKWSRLIPTIKIQLNLRRPQNGPSPLRISGIPTYGYFKTLSGPTREGSKSMKEELRHISLGLWHRGGWHARYIARSVEMRNAYKVLIAESEERTLGRRACKWQHNIKIDLKFIEWYHLLGYDTM
jgi:hypothetical protein